VSPPVGPLTSNCGIMFVLGRRGHVLVQALEAAGFDVSCIAQSIRRTRLTFIPEFVRQAARWGRQRPAMVIADSVESAPVAHAIARLLGLPLCVRVRGDAWAEAAQAGPRGYAMRLPGVRLLLALYGHVLRHADVVVPVSRFLGERIRAAALVPSERIWAIPICVNPTRFTALSRPEARGALGWDGRDEVVLTVTNFRFPAKIAALQAALAPMRALMERRARLRWVIVGGGPVLAPFRVLADRALGPYACRLDTPGQVDSTPPYYAGCNAVAHLSGLEALSRAVLEAQAAGRVVVASPVGGIPELISDGLTGYLVTDETELLAALTAVLDSAEPEQSIGRAAQAAVLRRFTPDVIGTRWRELIDHVRTGAVHSPTCASSRLASTDHREGHR
jgi:glycosyltransferase involved in cell wall biosynthesis